MPDSIHTPTPNHRRSPPILTSVQLNTDILWYIFCLNANMEQETQETEGQDPALVTLRYTSQVCTAWRTLAIGSSTLWARVLNVNFLSQEREEWRHEVIRRTGTAALHIKTIDYLPPSDIKTIDYQVMQVVQRLLAEHWTRIRSLQLELNFYFDEPVGPVLLSVFQRPAPSLQVFEISFPSRDPMESDSKDIFPTDLVLFSNNAPSLRTLNAAVVRLDFTTFPFPNLRHLTLHPQISAFDMLSAISHMPLLETLEGAPFYDEDEDEDKDEDKGKDKEKDQRSLPLVTLPRLTTIKSHTWSGIDSALDVLAHITPSTGCALDFFGTYRYTSETPGHVGEELSRQVLLRYSQCCTELANVTNLAITLSGRCYAFSANISPFRRFSFILAAGPFQHSVTTSLLSSFTIVRFGIIKKLELHMDSTHDMHFNEEVRNFIGAFVSVEELETDPITLVFLRKIFVLNLLPSLKIIHVDNVSLPDHVLWVAHFIELRIELGAPIDALIVKMGCPPKGIVLDKKRITDISSGPTVQLIDFEDRWRGI